MASPIDFTHPTTADNYLTAFVPAIIANQLGQAMWLDSVQTSYTAGLVQYMKRFNRTTGLFDEYNGTTWAALPTGYATLSGSAFTGQVSSTAQFVLFGSANSYSSYNAAGTTLQGNLYFTPTATNLNSIAGSLTFTNSSGNYLALAAAGGFTLSGNLSVTGGSISGSGSGLTGTASAFNVGYASSAGNSSTVGGFTPVQQGGGISQTANKVFIGWSSAGALKCTVDSSDEGYFLLTSNYNQYAPTLTGGGASGNWAINVSGSSSYATNSGTASTASGQDSVNNWGFESNDPTLPYFRQTSTNNVIVLATRSLCLGIDQTWQNPSRSAGSSYTNSETKPIYVSVSCGGIGGCSMSVSGISVSTASVASGYQETVSGVVPPGASYSVSVSGSTSVVSWAELR